MWDLGAVLFSCAEVFCGLWPRFCAASPRLYPAVGRQNRREATQNLPKGPKPCAQRKQNRREAAKNRREATKKP